MATISILKRNKTRRKKSADKKGNIAKNVKSNNKYNLIKELLKKLANSIKRVIDREQEQIINNNVKIWLIYNIYNPTFPERNHSKLKGKQSLLLCYSDGGCCSTSCSIAQMRTLKKYRLDEKTKYISPISGGSWFTLPFSYLPRNTNDTSFIGPYIPQNEFNNETTIKWSRNSFIFSKYAAWRVKDAVNRHVFERII